MRYLFLFFLIVSALFSQENVPGVKKAETKDGFQYKSDYDSLESSIDSAIEQMDQLGYLWTSKGMLYFYDYKFKDGNVSADYNKAELCFEKSIERGDNSSYFFYVSSLFYQNKINKGVKFLEDKLKTLERIKNNSEASRNDYKTLSHLYAGIIIERSLDVEKIQKAISWIYESAEKEKDSSSQLAIGLLYRMLNKMETSDYFIFQACKSSNKGVYVKIFCDSKIIPIEKECESCKIKEEIGMD